MKPTIIKNHFYFDILRKNKVFFYDENKVLEPLKIEKSYFEIIERKFSQVTNYIKQNNFKNRNIVADINKLSNLLLLRENAAITREEVQTKLEASNSLVNKIVSDLETLRIQQQQFDGKRVCFVLGKRMEELGALTNKELELNAKQDKELLFDPTYE
jgi:hypothetical protein